MIIFLKFLQNLYTVFHRTFLNTSQNYQSQNILHLLRPAMYLSQNMQKRSRKMKSVQRGILYHFFRVSCPFLCFSHFATFHPRIGIRAKSQKNSCFFFRGINKIRNLYEIRKVYNECYVFCGEFRKNQSYIEKGKLLDLLRNRCQEIVREKYFRQIAPLRKQAQLILIHSNLFQLFLNNFK